MPRKLLTPVLALGALLAGLLVAVGTPAQAAVDYPTICSDCVTFDPVETRFSADSETLTATVEVDVSADWAFVSGVLYIVDPNGYGHYDDWLKITGETRVGNKNFVTFRGQVPNQYAGQLERGYLDVYPFVYYRSNNNELKYANYDFSYPFQHRVTGNVRTSLDAPATIPTGSALTLSGKFTCFRFADYQVNEQGGYTDIYLSQPGANAWQYRGSVPISQANGTWSFTEPAVGGTFDWRAVVNPNDYYGCAQGVQDVVTVQAGSGPPPPPPTLPGAPGLTVGAVTEHTVALDWSAPSDGAGITGYRFGWDSANGLPSPSFSTVVSNPADPFVMTNLCAGCRYTMWVEAVTATGTGDRASVQVTTTAAPTPPPSATAPGAPRKLKGKAGSHQALLTWKAPKKVAGAKVTKYCVHQYNHDKDKCVKASKLKVVMKKLKNNATYTFAVRAFAGTVPGPFSRPVKVRPHR